MPDFLDTDGSLEDAVADLGDAVDRMLADVLPDVPAVSWVEATFGDHAIVGVATPGQNPEFWEVPFRIDDGHLVSLGEPTELAVAGVAVGGDGKEFDFLPPNRVVADALLTKSVYRARRRLLLLAQAGVNVEEATGMSMADLGLDDDAVGGGQIPAAGADSYLDLGKWLVGVHELDNEGKALIAVETPVETDTPKAGESVLDMFRARLTDGGTVTGGEATVMLQKAAALLAEVKAGAVLNASNADRITAAFDALGEVLMDAGMFDVPDDTPAADENAPVVTDTTSGGDMPKGMDSLLEQFNALRS